MVAHSQKVGKAEADLCEFQASQGYIMRPWLKIGVGLGGAVVSEESQCAECLLSMHEALVSSPA